MADETTTETTETTQTTTDTEVVASTEAVAEVEEQTETSVKEGDDDETTLLGGKSQTEEDGGEGDEGEGDDSAPEGAPEEYELSLKDADGNDVALDPEMLGKATEIFKEMNLSNEEANKLLPLGQEMMDRGVQAAQEQSMADHSALKKQWLEEFKADEQIGGAKQEETLHLAAKGLDALGFTEGHPFREMLNVSGLGNQRDMIFAFSKLGSLVGEDDQFAVPDGASEEKVAGWGDLYNKSN